MAKRVVYIGTYTGRGSEGIYRAAVDCQAGTLELLDAVPSENPSYVALARNGRTLYATAETMTYNGRHGGAVRAFAVGPQGRLTYLNEQPTEGQLTCHLATDPGDRRLFCANYQEGTATVFPLAADGSLGAEARFLMHQGAGPNPRRQEKAHVHFTRLTPDDRFLAVADLGMDEVTLYPFDGEAGVAEPPAVVREEAGSGPRHLDFTPDGRFAYLVCEMGNLVIAHAYDGKTLTPFQRISTVPEGITEAESTCAAIRVSPDGRFVCASNRGHDSLAVFAIAGDGRLTPVQIAPCGGQVPRDFVYAPGGGFVLVANQESSRLSLLAAAENGRLTDTGRYLEVPHPTCVCFGGEL